MFEIGNQNQNPPTKISLFKEFEMDQFRYLNKLMFDDN